MFFFRDREKMVEVCSIRYKDQQQKNTKQKTDNNKKNFQFPDKSNSPTTHRTVSMSDIRMPRVTSNGGGSNSGQQQQQQTLSPTAQQQSQQTQQSAASGASGGSGAAAVVSGVVGGGGNSSQTTNTNSGANSTIVTIKQESLGNVDNLVGSYVDSTTFLHSPSSQMVNPNLVQNNSGLSGIGAGENMKFQFYFKSRKETNFFWFLTGRL